MKRRRFRPKPLTTRRKVLLATIVAIPLLAVFTFSNRGLIKRFSLESRYNHAHQELYRARAEGDSLRNEIERLKSDTLAVEQIARERYGMARAGETVYKVVEEE